MDLATRRVKKELRSFFSSNKEFIGSDLTSGGSSTANGNEETIFVFPNESNMMEGHALVIGPDGTPYQKGLFLFSYKFPPNYPFKPPAVQLLTTGRNERVRFNPNLYANGKVCLSIIGTWQGPGWSEVFTMETVLISIQSLMTEEPFHNEPGFEKTGKGQQMLQQSAEYSEVITFYTLKVAIIEQAELAAQFPSQHIRDLISYLFLKHYAAYRSLIQKKISDSKVNGQRLLDYHGGRSGGGDGRVLLNYADLLKRLDAAREALLATERIAGCSFFSKMKTYYTQNSSTS